VVLYTRNAKLKVTQKKRGKVAKDEKGKFDMYKDWLKPLRYVEPHQTLAIFRGKKLGVLTVVVEMDKGKVTQMAQAHFSKRLGKKEGMNIITKAMEDAVKKLHATMQTRIFSDLKDTAMEQALIVFQKNLKQILLRKPVVSISLMMRVFNVFFFFFFLREGCEWLELILEYVPDQKLLFWMRMEIVWDLIQFI